MAIYSFFVFVLRIHISRYIQGKSKSLIINDMKRHIVFVSDQLWGSQICWCQMSEGRQEFWCQIYEGTQMPKAKVETEPKEVGAALETFHRSKISDLEWKGSVQTAILCALPCFSQRPCLGWMSESLVLMMSPPKKDKCHKMMAWSNINDIREQVSEVSNAQLLVSATSTSFLCLFRVHFLQATKF